MNDAGKGDTYRPLNRKLWDEGYDRIFNKDKRNAATDEQTITPEADSDKAPRGTPEARIDPTTSEDLCC